MHNGRFPIFSGISAFQSVAAPFPVLGLINSRIATGRFSCVIYTEARDGENEMDESGDLGPGSQAGIGYWLQLGGTVKVRFVISSFTPVVG
jgi:hypothetical protein